MKTNQVLPSVAAFFAIAILCSPVLAKIGESGKTYASDSVRCAATDPVTEVGLQNPKRNASATILLNGVDVGITITAANPATDVRLADGDNKVQVEVNKHTVDTYTFYVPIGACDLPETSGNTFSADGSLEYAASGKSYATVAVGCALNPLSGVAQPYINLFDNGNYLLNVSVNGLPLTQLSRLKSHTPVFLGAVLNVISVVDGFVSVDYFVREGGDGTCVLQ